VRKDYYRVDALDDLISGNPWPVGTIVEDLHETQTMAGSQGGETHRHVRHGGHDEWLAEVRWWRGGSGSPGSEQRFLTHVAGPK
jgi:hypothetical protein